MNLGVLQATTAFVLWGVFPLYFQLVQTVPALEMMAHRIVGSVLLLGALLAARGQLRTLRAALVDPRVVATFTASACLLACNWYFYIWAVGQGRVTEASLGYFITPLFNVALGAAVLHERLRGAQWLAMALASAGVLWLGWHAGAPPWIALVLAASFSVYGLLRKTASLGALEGLALETCVLTPWALAWLVWLAAQGQSVFVASPWDVRALVLLAGPITALPLLLFGAGARRIAMAVLGMLQFIAPSIQFVLGVWVFHEACTPTRLLGFGLIWAALGLYSLDALWRARSPLVPSLD